MHSKFMLQVYRFGRRSDLDESNRTGTGAPWNPYERREGWSIVIEFATFSLKKGGGKGARCNTVLMNEMKKCATSQENREGTLLKCQPKT